MDVEQLRGLPPLEGISEEGLVRVAACAAEVAREAGQVLALPDDPGSGMYVICDGTVAVELRTGTIELGPGDFFGELALLVHDGTRVRACAQRARCAASRFPATTSSRSSRPSRPLRCTSCASSPAGSSRPAPRSERPRDGAPYNPPRDRRRS